MGAVSRSLKATAGAARVFLRRVRQLPARAGALDRRSAAAAEQLRVAQEDIDALRSRGDEVAAALEASGARFAELRDSIHLGPRRTALQRRPPRVLFRAPGRGAWASSPGLVEAMVRSADSEPVVASIPRRFRGSNGLYGEEEVDRGLAN